MKSTNEHIAAAIYQMKNGTYFVLKAPKTMEPSMGTNLYIEKQEDVKTSAKAQIETVKVPWYGKIENDEDVRNVFGWLCFLATQTDDEIALHTSQTHAPSDDIAAITQKKQEECQIYKDSLARLGLSESDLYDIYEIIIDGKDKIYKNRNVECE